MGSRHLQVGHQGEAIALKYLKKNGYKIIEKNYRSKLGEIDIIAKDQKTLTFIEVKTRQSVRYGHPKAAITHQKQKKISMVALGYLKETNQSNHKARFDVVSIIIEDKKPQVEIVKNAFELAYG
jgi:putative endonuclease